MNEFLPETISLRSAEVELRRLYVLRDGAMDERQKIKQVGGTPAFDVGAAMAARALAGDDAGAQVVFQTAATAVGRIAYLANLIEAVNGRIESHSFEVERLIVAANAATAAQSPAAKAWAANPERLREFRDDVVIPAPQNLSPEATWPAGRPITFE